ncbi:iron uptake transporter permease EfeU [Candidatus Protofrankia californiensis]|uniref:iron uptake transporter permease EfeU n=1 Tax=Candidatus Protofrankia californiensis TaxID=1839754 RepID=UPI00104163A5|nr:iron uptake transporter permease EfeU [Candidatus Protofrankia californiensis]
MWADLVPNLLIGLREGFEASLIVAILVATLVRADQRARLPQVWTGVLAAVALSASFGAVLTFAAASMSTAAQEAFSGVLSLVAVGFVTAMVFWMRRSARALSGEIKGRVTAALALGPGVLILTAFLAVAREGLETSLFVWTTTRGADESVGPLVGATAGIALAAAACFAMYRQTLKIDLTRFFTITGIGLIVIAAGVTGYGLHDLQESDLLPGNETTAFDLTATVDPSAWYSRLTEGILNLTPRMTVLQVVGYLAYLVPVLALFVRGARPAAPAGQTPPSVSTVEAVEAAAAGEAAAEAELGPVPGEPVPGGAGRAPRAVPRWVLPVTLVAVPAIAAGTAILALGPSDDVRGTTIEVAAGSCAAGWDAPQPGRQTFTVRNTGGQSAEVRLIDPASGAIHAEIELLAPGTSRDLSATVGGGTYAWQCLPDSDPPIVSASRQVAGSSAGGQAIIPVTEEIISAPVDAYRAFVTAGLVTLQRNTDTVRADVEAGDLDAARRDWLTAHLDYERLGAAYGTFGDFDAAINGRPDGLPGGVADEDFTGFHRIEYGLWHGESADSLKPLAARLATDVTELGKAFPTQEFDPNDLALRTHEILENTLQFQLTGSADQGSGSVLATASANTDGTRELLEIISPLLTTRAPDALAAAERRLDAFATLLRQIGNPAGTWIAPDRLPLADRQRLNGSLGGLLETLAPIPDVLEIRSTG